MNYVGYFLVSLLAICSAASLGTSYFEPKDEGDKTLQFYLDNSEIVVRGKIENNPIGVTSEIGVFRYLCEFKIVDVLKGDQDLKGTTQKVTIKSFQADENDKHPAIAKDAKSILFLNRQKAGTIPALATADFWFGIQHDSAWLARSLKRIASQ